MTLCQACNRALYERPIGIGDAEPRIHHDTIFSFIDAVNTRCHICSTTFKYLTVTCRALLHELSGLVGMERSQLGRAYGQGHFSELKAFVLQQRDLTGLVVVTDLSILKLPAEFYTFLDHLAAVDGPWTYQKTRYLRHEMNQLASYESLAFAGSIAWCIGDDRSETNLSAGCQYTATRTNSAEVFEQIKQWIDDCLTNHHSCQTPNALSQGYPTRLVKIGDLDKEGKVSACHLVDGVDAMKAGERYATVSHRWGSDQFLTLTAMNIADFRVGIPLQLISKTLVDCMEVARRLGIHYIWIDSLCIIQSGDNLQDWIAESVKMDQVYSNGFCNIMAGWGTAQNGMFFDRDPDLLRSITAHFVISSPTGDVTTREASSVDGTWWKKEAEDSPLNRRAWTLQERVLSQRNVHFGRQQVLWECAERVSSERSPNHPPWSSITPPTWNTVGLVGIAQAERLKSMQKVNQDTWITRHDDRQLWKNIVRNYSKREMTNLSDKLVALSGVAKYMKRKFDDIYVCGLWKQNIANEVLWCRASFTHGLDGYWNDWITSRDSHANTSVGNQKPCYIPSFSWASIHYPPHGVIPPTPSPEPRLLVRVNCVKYRPSAAASREMGNWSDQPVTNDCFGLIYQPSIELKVIGRVLPAKLVSDDGIHLELRPLGCPSLEFPHATKHGTTLRIDNPILDSEFDRFLSQTYYYISWKWGGSAGVAVQGLLLQLEDEEMARYRRIGLLAVGNPDTNMHIYLESWGYDRAVPCWDYDETSGEHTIYIV
ncbi:Heterokaryon incompatibility protein (HET) domain containing protein [Naviculisporaceae sp. PSN 640]